MIAKCALVALVALIALAPAAPAHAGPIKLVWQIRDGMNQVLLEGLPSNTFISGYDITFTWPDAHLGFDFSSTSAIFLFGDDTPFSWVSLCRGGPPNPCRTDTATEILLALTELSQADRDRQLQTRVTFGGRLPLFEFALAATDSSCFPTCDPFLPSGMKFTNSRVFGENGFVFPVPEPGTLSLLGAGLIAFGIMRRRKLLA